MRKTTWWKRLGLIASAFVLLLSYTPLAQQLAIPQHIRAFSGSEITLPLAKPVSIQSTDTRVLRPAHSDSAHPTVWLTEQAGSAKLQMKAFGTLPLGSVSVDVLSPLELVPGGQSIGVQLQSAGIMVVGFHQFQSKEGESLSPGSAANIRIGDLIYLVDGKSVTSTREFAQLVQKAGKAQQSLHLHIARGREKLQVQLKPEADSTGKYQVGLYIRDSAAGVGTLTFWNPKDRRYGALGHVITDMDTQKPIVVGSGHIYPSHVSSIDKGESGTPGQKRAFFQGEEPLGTIEKNTPFGIFGYLNKLPSTGQQETMPVALAHEVRKGPAIMRTVLEGSEVKDYRIEIADVFPQQYPATKGMIIKVTDPELLKKTGGIIQGMSGSPILQDGKIVGAVTHVFVNDPTSGYATFIEWMLRDAGLLEDVPKGKKKAS